MIGCLPEKGRGAFLRRPPARSDPCLSRKGVSGARRELGWKVFLFLSELISS